MFGIGGTEFLIIVIFVLLVFGPDKLPAVGRTVGHMMREFKRAQETMEAVIKAEVYADGKTKVDTGMDVEAEEELEEEEEEDDSIDVEPATPEEAGGWTPGKSGPPQSEATAEGESAEGPTADDEPASEREEVEEAH